MITVAKESTAEVRRRRILKITEENRAKLLDAWNEFFGS